MFFKFILLVSASVFYINNFATYGKESNRNYLNEFDDYRDKYNKTYNESEYFKRLSIFISNKMRIKQHNEAGHSWNMSVNQFTDLTSEEFKNFIHFKGYNSTKFKENVQKKSCSPNFTLPSSFDWVKNGAVTKVKNQGQCGSCWTFSVTGAVEGAWFVKNKKLISLSEQEIVDCCNADYGFTGSGCNGGEMTDGFYYVQKNGLCKEHDYSYTAEDGKCKRNSCNKIVTISGYETVTPNNEEEMRRALFHQPLSIGIDASSNLFQFYSHGVYTTDCGYDLDHGVLAVGWGVLNGTEYWRVKNSWGSDWGDNGYINIQRNTVDKRGKCGIAMQPSYPVV